MASKDPDRIPSREEMIEATEAIGIPDSPRMIATYEKMARLLLLWLERAEQMPFYEIWEWTNGRLYGVRLVKKEVTHAVKLRRHRGGGLPIVYEERFEGAKPSLARWLKGRRKECVVRWSLKRHYDEID